MSWELMLDCPLVSAMWPSPSVIHSCCLWLPSDGHSCLIAHSKSELVLPILPMTVPPSAPHCQIQGSQDIGSDVILLCSSEEGIPRPTYLWEKLDNTLKLPPTATQGTYSA